jgi:hypothetical protein
MRAKDEGKRRKLDAALLQHATYIALADQYTTVFQTGFSIRVPDTWNDAAVIRIVGNVQLTWGEMFQLLNLSPFFRTKVSVGLMQTLIDTGMANLRWIGNAFADIQATFPQTPAPANWWSYFNVAQPPLPAQAGEYLKKWLLVPRHSILAGTVYIRLRYNNDPKGTFWDPPKAAAAYNHGSVAGTCLRKDDTPAEKLMRRTWGLCYSEDYMTIFGQTYNGAVQYFNDNPNLAPTPTVRLRR